LQSNDDVGGATELLKWCPDCGYSGRTV